MRKRALTALAIAEIEASRRPRFGSTEQVGHPGASMVDEDSKRGV